MGAPSITCPHCGLTSYLRSDIQSRYCGKCGYIDADRSVPPGIPGKSAKWRQPTPLMQLQATLASFEGIAYVWKEGMTPDSKFKAMLDRFLDDARELMPHVINGDWKKDR